MRVLRHPCASIRGERRRNRKRTAKEEKQGSWGRATFKTFISAFSLEIAQFFQTL